VKAPSPLLGFNNNVRHKGRVFHIQTEDSGIRHPHIITHLFADGGRILKTTKTSYAEHIGNEKLAETVRAMMQEQHKAMFIALRDGQFDYLFDENAGPASTAAPRAPEAKAKAAVTMGPQAAPNPAPPVAAPTPPAAPPAPPPVVAAPPAPPPQVVVTPPPAPSVAARSPQRGTMPTRPAMAPTEPAMPTPQPQQRAPQPEPAETNNRRRTGQGRPRLDVDPAAIHGVSGNGEPGIDLDLDALERAAAEAQTPFFQQIQDLPPPPAAVLGANRAAAAGGYSVRSPAPPPTAPNAPLPRAGRQTNPMPQAPPAPPNARYAPSRPASIFATTRPQEGASIFGEDLISEKSLDEVILSYLAEDLDGPGDKK
jgi:hypothetical protein